MEYIQIVDKNGNFTGEIKEREEVHHKNLLHNEISIFIINDKNEVLLEKRSPNKKYSPNKWGLCGGHVSAHESLEEAALREGKEELGLEISLNKLHPFGKREFILEQTNSHFIYSYYVKSNLKENEFILQKEEVSEVKWVNIDTIIEMILSHNESLTKTTSLLLSHFYQLKTVILKNGYVEM
ncbi:MAG: NUDIX domain-containing protein [Erysipelotrichaceae bacterium]|nr:NUDIX domain-containing protein [Erysipelotrichaceae bacterium]